VGGLLVLGGVVAVGVGVGFHSLATIEAEDAAIPGISDVDAQDHLDRARADRLIGTSSLLVGGALITAGVLRWLLHDHVDRVPVVAPTGDGGAVVTWGATF
jgi:hypothetical protein